MLAGVYRRLGWTDESRKALEEFKRLERESAELEKKRRSVAPSTPKPPGRSVNSATESRPIAPRRSCNLGSVVALGDPARRRGIRAVSRVGWPPWRSPASEVRAVAVHGRDRRGRSVEAP